MNHKIDLEDNCINRNIKNTNFISINKKCKDDNHKFIADDETVECIIENDKQILKKHGITREQILQKLKWITSLYLTREYSHCIDHPNDNQTNTHSVGGLKIKMVSWSRMNTCPFQIKGRYHGYEYGTLDYIVTRDPGIFDFLAGIIGSKPDEFKFTDLNIHMFDFHDFCGGNASQRLDLEKMIKFFDMKPGIDYSPKLGKIASYAVLKDIKSDSHRYKFDDYIHDFKFIKYSSDGWLFNLNSNLEKKLKMNEDYDYISIRFDSENYNDFFNDSDIIVEYDEMKFKIWKSAHWITYRIVKQQLYLE